ncbi:AAA family ATPase [Luteolibacter sp. Populi]|uniref:AAA family ATPase n=1 Tax=Luteolibacter sp. Populi TaxID=3230487 RepID=UPI00346666C5
MAVEIQKLGIAGYRQFQETFFDFTDPKTGKPLRKICFIGGNGTGKSTLLKLLWRIFEPGAELPKSPQRGLILSFLKEEALLWSEAFFSDQTFSQSGDEAAEDLWALALSLKASNELIGLRSLPRGERSGRPVTGDIARTRCLYCPADSEQGFFPEQLRDVPSTNLDAALKWDTDHGVRRVVGQGTVYLFWLELMATIKDREAKLIAYQKIESNRERTIREVEEEFLEGNPDILKELADFWDVILGKAGLEFDYKNASVPIQLTDNLKAYIRLKRSEERIPYVDLSTGLRNFILKLGHIFTMFRGKPENGGVLLIDEPENSLYPDFLFDLVGHYERAAPGAQIFMATHSPIIAAQFRPEERFILEFDENGGVTVRNGVTPEGDDPNDVLMRDFAVRTLYGPKGLEKWKRFRELDRVIQEETDPATRRVLLKEYMDLGKAYNFSPDEVPA